MKTRVARYYHVATGVWLYGVDCWYEQPMTEDPAFTRTGRDYHWWPWPLKPPNWMIQPTEKVFETPERERAVRIARDVSLGKDVSADPEIYCEFSDGVEFNPPP